MRYDLKSEPGKYAGVYLVAPDQQAFVCLEDYDQDNICEIPDGIPTDWKPYYKAGFGSVYLEKLGKNQNDITKLAPSVKTYSKSYESGLLKVECDPKVDWLRIGTYYIDSPMGGRYLGWTIEGKPDVFEHVELPDLSAYVSGGREIFGNLFKDGRISYTMFYSEEFDYEDMKIGLPWKTAGLFSLGQKGYEIVNE